MSNGLSSLGTSASINASNAFSTKIDVVKNSADIAWDSIFDSITDVLETREEIIASSASESMLDWVLKPVAAVVGFYFGGPAGAAAAWSATDFVTDVASPSPTVTPRTRAGVDMKSAYTASRPGGGDLAGDMMGYAQEAYSVFTLTSGLQKGYESIKNWRATDTGQVDPSTVSAGSTAVDPLASSYKQSIEGARFGDGKSAWDFIKFQPEEITRAGKTLSEISGEGIIPDFAKAVSSFQEGKKSTEIKTPLEQIIDDQKDIFMDESTEDFLQLKHGNN